MDFERRGAFGLRGDAQPLLDFSFSTGNEHGLPDKAGTESAALYGDACW